MPELKLNIDNMFDKTLADLVRENSNASTKADVVQRAVATYKYFRSDLPPGARIQVVDSNNNVIEENVEVP